MREGGIFQPFPGLALGTVFLPFTALIICFTWSILFHFEASTSTHCEVEEFAPSISAVIGSNIPQKYVWNICIALQAAPRFLFSHMYRKLFQERLKRGTWTVSLVKFNWVLNVVENFCLLGLSFVGSSEVFPAHAFFFILFLITYMVSMCLVMMYLIPFCGFQIKSKAERESHRYKKILVKLTFISSLSAFYFYWRHNEYCEPYVYSFFGVCEYVLILGNMAYHALAYKDFADYSITIGPNQILVR